MIFPSGGCPPDHQQMSARVNEPLLVATWSREALVIFFFRGGKGGQIFTPPIFVRGVILFPFRPSTFELRILIEY
jgi:hypothetical protein